MEFLRSEVNSRTKFLFLLWSIFLLVVVTGHFVVDIFRVVFLVTSLYLYFCSSKERQVTVDILRRILKAPVVWSIIGLVTLMTWAAYILNYEGLHGTLWDLGQFIQVLHNYATRGVPEFTFIGESFDYTLSHDSWSLHVLAFFYKLFPSVWMVLTWQSVLLVMPGIVFIAIYRASMKLQGVQPEPIGDLLAFLFYIATPTFLGQVLWPYVFHIAGISCLALAYLFYLKKQWLLWALSLFLFAFDKDIYGLIAAPFALMVFIDAFVSKEKKFFPASLSLIMIAVGLFAYVRQPHPYDQFAQFSNRFYGIGATPKEAFFNLFLDPIRYINALLRVGPLYYLSFFLVASLIWLRPRWEAFKFFFPVFPMLGINCLASFEYMYLLKDHYALPLIVGLGATRLVGVFPKFVDKDKKRRLAASSLLILLAVAVSPLLWQHRNLFQVVYNMRELYSKRTEARQMAAKLRSDPNLTVCCEDRLCSYFAQRNNFYQLHACRPEFVLDRRPLAYILYSGTPAPENSKVIFEDSDIRMHLIEK